MAAAQLMPRAFAQASTFASISGAILKEIIDLLPTSYCDGTSRVHAGRSREVKPRRFSGSFIAGKKQMKAWARGRYEKCVFWHFSPQGEKQLYRFSVRPRAQAFNKTAFYCASIRKLKKKGTVKGCTGINAKKELHALAAIEIENAPLGISPTSGDESSVQSGQPTTERTLSIADLLAGAILFFNASLQLRPIPPSQQPCVSILPTLLRLPLRLVVQKSRRIEVLLGELSY
ncbi:MAG: hypothetical protein WC091_02075 [Sulfuricellaceae bacterium]